MAFERFVVPEGGRERAEAKVGLPSSRTLQLGDQIAMTALGRRHFRPPYMGEYRGQARSPRGAIRVLRFGSEVPQVFPAKFWVLASSIEPDANVLCDRCGVPAGVDELDECLGCARVDLCIRCMAEHKCGHGRPPKRSC